MEELDLDSKYFLLMTKFYKEIETHHFSNPSHRKSLRPELMSEERLEVKHKNDWR